MIKRLLGGMLALMLAMPLSAQTWKPGRQLMIWPRPDTVLLGDSLVFVGLARTSTGATVMAPRIYWFTAPPNKVFAREVAGNAASIISADSGQLRITAEWRTSNGTYRDTLMTYVKWRPYQWKLGQRLLMVASDTVIRQPGDQITLRLYARTSSGVPVTNPGILWTMYNINDVAINSTIPLTTVLTGRPDTLGGFRTWIKAEWKTSAGTFADSVPIITLKYPVPPTSYLPPYQQYPLDTVHIFKTPYHTPRPGILGYGDGYNFSTYVDRVDEDGGDRTPFRIWIHDSYQYAYSDSARLQGAVVMSPMSCPNKSGWDAPMWDIRWAPPSTQQDPNIVAPVSLAKAAAAQLPLRALKDMARVSMERYLERDSTWVLGKHVYSECFGEGLRDSATGYSATNQRTATYSGR